MAHLPLHTPDDDLIPLLRNASSDDLGILVGYIAKDYNQDLRTVPEFTRLNPDAKDGIYDGDHRVYADDIAAEIQRYAGNSFSNHLARDGRGIPYIAVVRKVADHCGVKHHKDADAATIEAQIQLKVLEKAYGKMSNEERTALLTDLGADMSKGIPKSLPVMAVQGAIRLSGFAAFRMALIITNAVSKAILKRGLSFAANRIMVRGISAFAGPIGWAVTTGWTLVDLAGPAYRILVPCVLQVAYIRQKAMTIPCPQCGDPQSTAAKFCQSCGAELQTDSDESSAAGAA